MTAKSLTVNITTKCISTTEVWYIIRTSEHGVCGKNASDIFFSRYFYLKQDRCINKGCIPFQYLCKLVVLLHMDKRKTYYKRNSALVATLLLVLLYSLVKNMSHIQRNGKDAEDLMQTGAIHICNFNVCTSTKGTRNSGIRQLLKHLIVIHNWEKSQQTEDVS